MLAAECVTEYTFCLAVLKGIRVGASGYLFRRELLLSLFIFIFPLNLLVVVH
jgi:hypothetical protein